MGLYAEKKISRARYVARTSGYERGIARAFLGGAPSQLDMDELAFKRVRQEHYGTLQVAIEDDCGMRIVPFEQVVVGDKVFLVAFDWTAMRAYYQEDPGECREQAASS